MSNFRVTGALPGVADPILEAIAANLESTGFAVIPDFLEIGAVRALMVEMVDLQLQRASIGRGKNRKHHAEVRTDFIHWLEPDTLTGAQANYWSRMRELRETLNRLLYLGLFELEAHLARFEPGGFYKPHLDRHQKTQARLLSAVLYLDENWKESEGGQLRLFTDRTAGVEGNFIDIFPKPGKLVLFLSADFWHEVCVAKRARHSLTGWFRRREEPVPGIPIMA